jgi:TetR/AcrR family transcriptional repressor of nem operon
VGRKKSYDREALIAKAMEVFRDSGFAGTSAERLCEALGVNRFSVYAEFGSKQALFDAALRRYDAEAVERNFGPLEAPDASLEEIRALLSFFGSARKSPAWGRGCLLCNTAVEFGPEDPSGAGFVNRYFKRLSAAFESALTNARRNGDLLESVDPRREAGFLTSSVLGMFVMLRAKAPTGIIKSAAQSAIHYLETLQTESAA